MRSTVIAMIAAFTSLHAYAANPSATCPLLGREDLAGLGVTHDTNFADSDWKWRNAPEQTPDATLVSSLCTVNLHSKNGNASVVLAVDYFNGKVTEEQVGDWLKTVSETQDADTTTMKVDEAVCETGHYELPTALDDGSMKNINELYVACDQQVGTNHISFNVHVPEAEKAVLPSPQEAKAIMDKSIQRLKDAVIGERI